MQKCVLISIQPRWCELIACGKKTVEVRKSYPTLVVGPFKCLMYQTKMKWAFDLLRRLGFEKTAERLELGFGKVIGEFTCDAIIDCRKISPDQTVKTIAASRIPYREWLEYANDGPVYGWHIKDPIIYDEPKPLSEFFYACKHPESDCSDCVYLGEHSCKPIKRPPQSWCYIEDPGTPPRLMYLGNCEEGDCPHWSWCGDSYGDRNTELFCKLCKDTIYRGDVDEKPKIYCPLGKMFEED